MRKDPELVCPWKGRSTVYGELVGADAVLNHLVAHGFLEPADGRLPIDDLLAAQGFTELASFGTKRTKSRVYDEGRVFPRAALWLGIDSDEASYGHLVLEVEGISSTDSAEIEKTRLSIQALAEALGLTKAGADGSAARGKLEEYLFRHQGNGILDRLMRAGVM
eukprot:scaffold8108_cov267-Pinguiococcus_pyrenoidosus.AAC.9